MSQGLLIPRRVYQKNYTAASTGATDTFIPVRPPQGYVYRVLACHAWHTAGANRNASFYMTTPEEGDEDLCDTLSLATATRMPLDYLGANHFHRALLPLWLTYNRYITFKWTASGVGENGYVVLTYEYQIGQMLQG